MTFRPFVLALCVRWGDERFPAALRLAGLRFECSPGSAVLVLALCNRRKKKPVLSYELFLKYGGEAGIRTPDTLPYTHFPGVLLQPLGHLTILLSRVAWTSANVGKRLLTVNKLFKKIVRLHKLQPTCFLNRHKSYFLRSPPHFPGQAKEICYSVKPQK